MAYENVNELPTQVLNSLDDADAQVWMDTYNAQNPKDEDSIRDAKETAWNACKTLPSSFAFEIVATVEDVDSDGELITLDTVKDKMDLFIQKGGVVQSDHGNYNVATIWGYDDYIDPESGYPGILVKGNVFGGRGDNEEYRMAREDFKNGKNSMSIAGDASIEGYECDGQRCFTRRNLQTLMEISLCEVPANEHCKLLWYNDQAIVKSKGEIRMKVQKAKIHKSYDECGLQEINKSLRDTFKPFFYKAMNVHVKKDGVHLSPPEGTLEIVKAICDLKGYQHEDTDEGITCWIQKEAGAMGSGTSGASNARYSDNDEEIQKKRVYLVTPDDTVYFQTLSEARSKLADKEWVSRFNIGFKEVDGERWYSDMIPNEYGSYGYVDDTYFDLWTVDAYDNDEDGYPIESFTLGELRDKLGIERRVIKSKPDNPKLLNDTRVRIDGSQDEADTDGVRATVIHATDTLSWVRLDKPCDDTDTIDYLIPTSKLIPIIEKD